MSGYAANARIQGVVPRFMDVRIHGATNAGGGVVMAAAAGPMLASHDRLELVGRPLDERLADWWTGLCEAWSETTFHLFDPDSWR